MIVRLKASLRAIENQYLRILFERLVKTVSNIELLGERFPGYSTHPVKEVLHRFGEYFLI
jgi:hypothetical protein